MEKTWRRGQNERCDRSTRARHAPPSRCSGARPRSSRASLGILPRSRRASAIRHRRASWRAQLGGRVESASWTATRTKRCPAHDDKSSGVGPKDAARMVRVFAHSKECHFCGRAYFEESKTRLFLNAKNRTRQKRGQLSRRKRSDSLSRTVRGNKRWSDLCCNFQGRRLTPSTGHPVRSDRTTTSPI